MANTDILPYTKIILKLFKGVLYGEDKDEFDTLLRYQAPLKKYFENIGIKLIIDVDNQMAFISQQRFKKEYEEDESLNTLPNLVSINPLSYPQSIICVILRNFLKESEIRSPDTPKHFISHADITKEADKLGLDEIVNKKGDAAKKEEKYKELINKMIDFGFLRESANFDKKSDDEQKKYEIRRIIKARISIEELQRIKEKLVEHLTQI